MTGSCELTSHDLNMYMGTGRVHLEDSLLRNDYVMVILTPSSPAVAREPLECVQWQGGEVPGDDVKV